MNRHIKILAVFSFALLFYAGCSSIESLINLFVGKWESGVFNLEFKSYKTFKLMIGKAISVNLEGKYEYDEDSLTLDIEGDSNVTFTYEFKDDEKKLILKPESEFNYINTKIEFTKE
ncbi:MAG: hypothetical protein O7C70_03235 [Candidatus Dadabacteria bacterium]|nr:hypothetical protein [Candidatus Dadabacteria bacterium]